MPEASRPAGARGGPPARPREGGGRRGGQQDEAGVAFVDPATEQVKPWPECVAFEADQFILPVVLGGSIGPPGWRPAAHRSDHPTNAG